LSFFLLSRIPVKPADKIGQQFQSDKPPDKDADWRAENRVKIRRTREEKNLGFGIFFSTVIRWAYAWIGRHGRVPV